MEFVILSVFDMYVGRSRLLSFQKKKKNMERTAFRIETKKKKEKRIINQKEKVYAPPQKISNVSP